MVDATRKIAIVDCLGVYPMVRLSLLGWRILAYLALRGRRYSARGGVSRALAGCAGRCRASQLPPNATEAAVQALRILCAPELPSFMSKQSCLLVIGHADTRGYGRYDNEALSKRRADNTIKAIQNVLGDKFRIENDGTHIQAIAAGDKLAAQQSGNKVLPASKHRQVQVFLNSVLVLTLFGSSSVP